MGIRELDFIFIVDQIISNNLNKGKILILGYQDVYFGKDYVKKIFKKYENFDHEKIKDTKNKNFYKHGFCDSRSLFESLGFSKVDILDASDYEGAEIIFDMNEELIKEHFNQYDFIFDWGTIEHVYDTKQYLTNIFSLLKSNGHYLCLAPASGLIEHGYYQYSPIFFKDYFRQNNWKVVNNFIINIKNIFADETWYIYEYIDNSMDMYAMGGIDDSIYFSYNLVKKDLNTTFDKIINQTQFVDRWNKKNDDYYQSFFDLFGINFFKTNQLTYNKSKWEIFKITNLFKIDEDYNYQFPTLNINKCLYILYDEKLIKNVLD